MDVDVQAYRPAVLFLNGKYWGIHNIREKINEHYIAENFGVDPNEVNLLEDNGSVDRRDQRRLCGDGELCQHPRHGRS